MAESAAAHAARYESDDAALELVTEELCENQRYLPTWLLGRRAGAELGAFSGKNLLPTDRRGRISTLQGVPVGSSLDEVKLPDFTWQWCDDFWSPLVIEGETDCDGWKYALDFFVKKKKWGPQAQATDYVRRRVMLRTRRRLRLEEVKETLAPQRRAGPDPLAGPVGAEVAAEVSPPWTRPESTRVDTLIKELTLWQIRNKLRSDSDLGLLGSEGSAKDGESSHEGDDSGDADADSKKRRPSSLDAPLVRVRVALVHQVVTRYRFQRLVRDYYASPASLAQRHRNMRQRELLTTEQTYCGGLEVLCDLFFPAIRRMKKEVNLGQEHEDDFVELERVFTLVETIRGLQVYFLKRLQNFLHKEWPINTRLGQIFLEVGHFLKMYGQVSSKYGPTTDTINKLRANAAARKYVVACEEICGRSFGDLFITLVQRIPRYEMLLKEIMAKTSDDHVDHEDLGKAVALVSKVALQVNETSRQHEQSRFVLQVQDQYGRDQVGQLVEPHRRLVKEGVCIVADHAGFDLGQVPLVGAPARRIILLNDLLLICNGEHRVLVMIRLAGAVVVREATSNPLALMILGWPKSPDDQTNQRALFTGVTKVQATLIAGSENERVEWVDAIWHCINELLEKRESLSTRKVSFGHDNTQTGFFEVEAASSPSESSGAHSADAAERPKSPGILEIAIYENQAYYPPPLRWAHPLFKERPQWSNERGQEMPVPSSYKLPDGYKWRDPEWTIDMAARQTHPVNKNGWEFATSFHFGSWRTKTPISTVRRRRWRRFAERVAVERAVAAEEEIVEEDVEDVEQLGDDDDDDQQPQGQAAADDVDADDADAVLRRRAV